MLCQTLHTSHSIRLHYPNTYASRAWVLCVHENVITFPFRSAYNTHMPNDLTEYKDETRKKLRQEWPQIHPYDIEVEVQARAKAMSKLLQSDLDLPS